MKKTFNLTIELGNDAMQTPEDVARKLRELAAYINREYATFLPEHHRIRDDNGNTVGSFGLEETK